MPSTDDVRLSPADTKTGALQRAALRVLLEHQASGTIPTSIRFVFYELVQAGTISKVARPPSRPGEKPRRADQDLIDAILALRDHGIVPWSWVVDETRQLYEWRTYPTILEGVIASVDSIRLNRWGRTSAPLIITESRAVAGVLRNLAYTYAVPIASTNGQAHGFLMTEVVDVYRRSQRVLYLGDLDLSGNDIEQHSQRVLERAAGIAILWERLAITDAQVQRYRIPDRSKRDERFDDGGLHLAYECEALSQQIILQIVEARLRALLPTPLDTVLERERRQRDQARRRLSRA